jgi:lipoprotein-releasing system permease protein
VRFGFELFVAWRYMRDRGRRTKFTYVPLLVGALSLAVSGVLFFAAHRIGPRTPVEIATDAADWGHMLQIAALGTLAGGVLACIFGYLITLQSVFTTISTYGVFLGTAALVIVLSVMNGFEVDLRQKILGSNAHLLITKEDGAFVEWREVEKKVHKVCADNGNCVEAHTPYVSSEVVIAANSNYAGVIIKGIDPRTVGKVTDLEKNLGQKSSLDKLWPILPDGGVGEYGTTRPDAGPDDAGPPDFSAPDAGEAAPPDFSAPDAGVTAVLPKLEDLKIPPALDPEFPRRKPKQDPRIASLDGILVGRELAKNLHLYVGQEVQVISPLGQDTPTGQVPRTRPFRVAGTFYSGMYEYDTKFVYVTQPALQSFLSLGDEVTGVEVKASDIDETRPLVAEIQGRLGPGYRVQDWKEINRNLFSALKLEKIAMFLVLTIIILVASFSIISNLIMVVVEKAKEIAILKSMGAGDISVMRVFVIEGLYIGALGTSFGLVVGIGTCLALGYFGLPLDPDVYYIDKLPVAMDPFAIVAVAFAGVLISVVATIYPSWIAARLRPVDGLRYQ